MNATTQSGGKSRVQSTKYSTGSTNPGIQALNTEPKNRVTCVLYYHDLPDYTFSVCVLWILCMQGVCILIRPCILRNDEIFVAYITQEVTEIAGSYWRK